jgi:hypothetical protein
VAQACEEDPKWHVTLALRRVALVQHAVLAAAVADRIGEVAHAAVLLGHIRHSRAGVR